MWFGFRVSNLGIEFVSETIFSVFPFRKPALHFPPIFET